MSAEATASGAPLQAAPVSPPAAHPFGLRLFIGVFGVFIAAVMSGLNNRVGAIALTEVKAGFGLGVDDGQWISAVYTAAELTAMPLAAWMATTFSLRRFHIAVVIGFTILGMLMPFAPGYGWLLAMRAAQGFLGGCLIPVLMAAALRFFPLPIRLYGLSLYSMTATFAPNLATWLSAQWTDTFFDWRLAYWQILPLAAFSLGAVAWGIPQDPVRLERLRQMDYLGLVSGMVSLAMIVIGLDLGERLDWFHSVLIVWLLAGGVSLFAVFLASEWFHPAPFVKLQLLGRRNLGLGFAVFVALLVVLLSGSLLPADYLAHSQGFRAPQIAPVGLLISLPQFVLAPLAAFLLYQRWIDARKLFAAGLLLLATACFLGAQITPDWMATDLFVMQLLQAVGQAFTVVPLLFLATSVVLPMEGPFASGMVNTLRAAGTTIGSALIGHLLVVRGDFHLSQIADQAGRRLPEALSTDGAQAAQALAEMAPHQAFVLSIADAYRALGALAILLIPAVLCLQYIPAPELKPNT